MTPRVPARVLALTVGDPRGIGPELVAAAIAPHTWRELVDGTAPEVLHGTASGPSSAAAPTATILPLVVGPHGIACPVDVSIGEWQPLGDADQDRALAGALSGRAIERAVALALDGAVHGIVTAPIDKRALADGGFDWPGHTEMLGALTGCATSMLLASDRLRVVLVTTHIPLRDVSDAVTVERIVSTAERTRVGLQRLYQLPHPRLALCGLNPHLGDGGRFGDEDERVLAVAARRAGIAGPFPADTVFVRAMRGEFDAVLAPVHDVGMTAIKVASFGSAVNITLGLPFPRTSPDHGTAIDIAGRGLADHGSFQEAVRLAAALVRRGEGGGVA